MAKTLTIAKDQQTLSYIITLFGTLQRLASDIELSAEGNKVFISKKDPAKIVTLDADAKPLEDKIFKFIDMQNAAYQKLNEDETKLFKHLSDAAYYYLTESNEQQSPARENFIQMYEQHIKTLYEGE